MTMDDDDQWPKQWPEDWQPADPSDLLRTDSDLETWVGQGLDQIILDLEDLAPFQIDLEDLAPIQLDLENVDNLLRTFDDTFWDGFDAEDP